MEVPQALPASAPKGYRSEEDRKRFMTHVALIAAALVLLQIVVPMVASMVMMPLTMMRGVMSLRMADAGSAVWHDGAVWYLVQTEAFPPGSGTAGMTLTRFEPDGKHKPEEVAKLDVGGGCLLTDGTELWLVSAEEVVAVGGGRADVLSRQVLGDCSHPFMYRGCPAVYEELPDGVSLRVFRDGQWERVPEAAVPPVGGQGCGTTDLRAVAVGEEIHCFGRGQQAILHWSSGLPAPGSWAPVANGKPWTGFSAMELDGAPAVVYTDDLAVVCRKLTGGQWQQVFRQPVAMASQVSACRTGEPGEFAVFIEGFPGSARVLTVRGGQLAADARSDGFFPFSMFGGMFRMILVINGLTMLFPLAAAFLLSREMLRRRTRSLAAAGRRAVYASLWRRACAQLVDALILSAPYVTGWMVFMIGMTEDFPPRPTAIIPAVLLILGGFMWLIAGLLVFSWMEGSSGQSPGKRLLGIRVASLELGPAGFGRALVRNLLRIVDGMFGFAVGMMLVAFTEKWQRLGDMAAHSVVIDAGTRRGPQES